MSSSPAEVHSWVMSWVLSIHTGFSFGEKVSLVRTAGVNEHESSTRTSERAGAVVVMSALVGESEREPR